MHHLSVLRGSLPKGKDSGAKDLLRRATGRFYTHELIVRHLINAVLRADLPQGGDRLRAIDPFSGDGRLIRLLLETAQTEGRWRGCTWEIELWDCDAVALENAGHSILEVGTRLDIDLHVKTVHGDTFARAPEYFGQFDVCVTNPPWDVLKPDRREIQTLDPKDAAEYISLLKKQDLALTSLYPHARPARKFSGWGTNLSRCGVEAALKLTAPSGVCGFVSPASLLADDMSDALRRWIFENHAITDVAHYTAEARLFEAVDQPCITIVAEPGKTNGHPPQLTRYDRDRLPEPVDIDQKGWAVIAANGHVFPLRLQTGLLRIQPTLGSLPRYVSLESDRPDGLWAGRELDETGHQSYLSDTGEHLFLKGRMVSRFRIAEQPTMFVAESGPRIPTSCQYHRIAWRDVSRPSQKRRVQAALIPPGWVTGNSLSVAYFRDGDIKRLKALLGVMNSFVFEVQVRGRLSTAHVSLGAVRQVHIPSLTDACLIDRIAGLVDSCIAGGAEEECRLEVAVARLYGFSREDFELVIGSFDKLSKEEIDCLLDRALWDQPLDREGGPHQQIAPPSQQIANHYSATLSALDLQIVRSVPPGGNWKNIPESVPSQRLKQIRESYAAGEGSRSTYYGRLRPDVPAYTINTYFSRPGNGCHIHYDYEGGQHRVLSHREAARLQSFTDAFVFHGSRTAVAQQIGNAVPPLLGYQIASVLPFKGRFIDLFAGAGGLALGFIWAGWQSIVANDIDRASLESYKANIHDQVVLGDIRDESIFGEIVRIARQHRGDDECPLFVLGGPPCQGFSTAGNRRSMDDERNWLFQQYKAILQALEPDGFIFENVTGLLNMEGGRVFEMVKEELSAVAQSLSVWKLRAEEYAIPQRRTRVILVGDCRSKVGFSSPRPRTQLEASPSLFDRLSPAVTVYDALSDLPPLAPGEDGSSKGYVCVPKHPYQDLMRGHISASTYLEKVDRG